MGVRATANVKINYSGVQGLLAKVASGLYDGVSEASELIRDDAKAICPVDTGALQSSIDAQVQRGIVGIMGSEQSMKSSSFAVTGIIAPHEHYAAYVEFGTGDRGRASAGAGPGPYTEGWPGQRAQPYMRPALDSNRANAVDIVRASVEDAIK